MKRPITSSFSKSLHALSLTALTVTLLLGALFLAGPALAESRELAIDAEATVITFYLEATGHDVEGRLFLQSGHLSLDPETGSASGELRIDATRAESGNDKRDKKMHKKVLESTEHPLIVFRAEKVEGTFAAEGPSELQIHGTVEIDGGEHPLTLPASVEMDGDHFNAEATFIVPYVEWGMHDPSVFILRVAKEVEVRVSAVGTFETGSVAASNR